MAPVITFTSKKPALSVTIPVGPEPPRITGGYGGWARIARPRRTALTHWEGRESLQQAVNVVFNHFRSMQSVEDDIQVLEQMALPYHNMLPPVIRISNEGNDGPALHTENEWVIDNIEWGESNRVQEGFRTRQAATVHLLKFVHDQYVKPPPPPLKNRNKKGKKSRRSQSPLSTPFLSAPIIYVAKEGDTLTSIAARELGDWRLWEELADINGLRDPDFISMGQHIRMIDHDV